MLSCRRLSWPPTPIAPRTSCGATSPASSARSGKCWSRGRESMPKIFFATDLHGSEVCWKKFLNAAKFYGVDILICGGDMTGKAILPILSENGHYTVAPGGGAPGGAAGQGGGGGAQHRPQGYY